MTTIDTDGIEVTVTEYSENPWGFPAPGVRFWVKAVTRDRGLNVHDPLFRARGSGETQEEAIENFRRSLALWANRRAEEKRLDAVRKTPISEVVVTL